MLVLTKEGLYLAWIEVHMDVMLMALQETY